MLVVPAWLLALEDEVEQQRSGDHKHDDDDQLKAVPQALLSVGEIQRQLDEWDQDEDD